MSEESKDIQRLAEHSSQTSSYRSIFKATSLFGGVQAYTILMQVVKSKVIAVLLGPLGVGIQGLYQSAIDMVKQASSLGISQSAVRDVAEANGTDDIKRISRTVTVLRKIVWFTGLLGMVGVIAFSPLLSQASFGNNDFALAFVILSVILLLDQLSAGQKVVLQGMRRLRDLAKATAIGVTISLMVSLPLYYLWGIKGIVPAMILTAVVTLFMSWFYSRKVKIESQKVTLKGIISEGKNMMVMGISMSLSGVLAMGVGYIIRSFIRRWGGIDEVGLFQAGFVIINSYVGLVFNAIATDYYPRLASVNKDNDACRKVVSQQGEISLFIMAPLLSICIVAMPIVIRILYSEQFLPADNYIKWACLGMMFRLASWIVSFIFVAKAESKLFVLNELLVNVYYLWLSIVGYKLGGLSGIGAAFAITYIVYFIQVFLISYFRYDFTFSHSFIIAFVTQLLFVTLSLVFMIKLEEPYNYVGSIIVVCLSVVLALKGLNNRLDLKSVIKKR